MTISSNVTQDWNETDWNRFNQWIRVLLAERNVKITFTKKDGTERVMNCTLDPNVIPLVESVQDKREKNKDKDHIAVFDTDIKAWRSFIVKSVKSFEFELG
jgi:hypothetical protein